MNPKYAITDITSMSLGILGIFRPAHILTVPYQLIVCLCEVWIDGASRGNPGPAAIAYLISFDSSIVKHARLIGHTTNNRAEYEALLAALEKAIELGCEEVKVNSDSELLVKQMRGEYRIRDEELRRIAARVKELEGSFRSVTYVHVSREKNREADKLVREVFRRFEEK